MGYNVRYEFALRIKAAHEAAALAVLNEVFKNDAATLRAAVEYWAAEFQFDLGGLKFCGNGDVEIEYNYYEKSSGCEEDILRGLAPYCDDTEITFYGEDGESWQYVIERGEFKRRHVVYVTDGEESSRWRERRQRSTPHSRRLRAV